MKRLDSIDVAPPRSTAAASSMSRRCQGDRLEGSDACYRGSPRIGLCGVTTFGGSCAISASGAWQEDSLQSCLMACASCGRCRYISFSKANADCSWYHTCNAFSEVPAEAESVRQTYITLDVSRLSGVSLPVLPSTLPGLPGHCAIVDRSPRDACTTHTRGAWPLPKHLYGAHLVMRWCVQRCHECERCRFVSFSEEYADCSWYSSCGPQLRGGVRGFRTVAVRQPAGEPPLLAAGAAWG